MSIILGKKRPAPMNRSISLTTADKRKYTKFLGMKELNSHIKKGSYKDKIFLVDALKGIEKLPVGCADLIFADPPYNIGKSFGNNIDRRSDAEYFRWNDQWISLCKDILKGEGAIYICCDWKYSGMFQRIISKYFTIRNRITWKRDKGRGAKTNWKNNMEDIWFATKSDVYTFNIDSVKVKKEIIAPYRVNGKPKDWVESKGERYRMTHPSNIWTDLVVPFWSMRENTPHPTQKPEKLLERVIEASSGKGSTVLDPFMGSGTTAVVAKKLGRKYMGFEINSEFVMLAYKRLEMI